MEILRLPSSVGIPGYSCSSRGQMNPSVMALKSSICVRSFHANEGRSLCLPGLRSYSMSGKQQGFCNSDDLEEVSLDWEEEAYDLQPPSGDEEAAEPVLSEVMDMEEVLTVEIFVDHPSYHRPGNPYGDKFGTFGDNQFRFTLLCHAACEAPLVLPLGGFTYGEKCLFLVNDWHASLVPILLAARYRPHGVYRDARCILIIHNLAHQGVEPAVTYENLGLPAEWYGALEWVFPTWARKHALDKGETVNPLKGAIVTADRVVTVSQGYAWEITTPEGGNGLDELLLSRKSVLSGITNGIDIDEWDPSSDEYISCNYSVDDLSGKVGCKTALQKELQFAIRADIPLIGFIGRLDYQKGIDLIRWAMPDLLQENIQFVMLGSGDEGTEEWMRETESAHKDKFRGWVGFSVAVSHRITAGCDILLMPSRFEPCGLNQLYAMRYGTVPVVHCTGGLRDTVENFDPFVDDGEDRGTGWAFSPLTKEAMLGTLRIAIETYRDHKASWERLMKRGMKRDSSWQNAAVQYEQIFEWALMDPPYVR
ncbi:Soluble starch synthase 1 [Nymphaea thermarum]|nr:Soluble starch synthase 1 [Nymphaea thermarum]